MIRIESKLLHALDVPIPGPGRSVLGYLRIPPASEKTEFGLGVVETDKLDNVTLARLQYHYEWRPSDGKLRGKTRKEVEAVSGQIIEIGLLKITDAPEGKPKNARAA
jgi:hypothetical protein